MERKNTAITWYILLALSAVLTLVTLFSNWFGVSLFSYSYNTTLLKIAKLASNLNNYMDSDGLSAFLVLTYCFLAAMVICAIVTIRSLFAARTSYEYLSKSLFICSILLSAYVILCILIMNLTTSDNTYGVVDSLFHLTFAPFFVLLGGIGGCYLCAKVPAGPFVTDQTSDAQNAVNSMVQNGVRSVQKFVEKATGQDVDELYCVQCQKTVPGGGKFCSTCGTELIPNTLVCPDCGERLPRDTAFCSHCGVNIKQAQAEARAKTSCKHCGAPFDLEALELNKIQYCPECGISVSVTSDYLKSSKGVCPSCGNYRALGKFCPACGRIIPTAAETQPE